MDNLSIRERFKNLRERFKKWFMVTVWRIQQTAIITSIFFAILTLVGIYYHVYVYPNFKAWGVIGSGENDYLIGMMYLYLLVFMAYVASGFMYDRVFTLWREQYQVMTERNVYLSKECQLFEKELVQYRDFHIPMAEGVLRIENALNLPENAELKIGVENAKKWVETGYVIGKEKR